MENSFKALLVFIFFISGPGTVQAEVISLGNHKASLDFKRHILNNSNLKSLHDTYIDNELNKSSKVIESKYELAVKGLLLEDLKPSIFVFKEITSLPNKFLLTSKSSDIISQSHMQLAHLDKKNMNFWLKHVLFFNPSYKPENGQFNPVVSKSLENNRAEVTPYLYSLEHKSIADADTSVFINGIEFHNSFPIHPSGNFKFTFLKDGFKKSEINVKGEDIAKLGKIKLKPLSLGTCKSPNFKKEYGIQIEKIYFSKDCIRSIQEVQAKKTLNQKLIPQSHPTKIFNQSSKPSKNNKNIFQRKSTWYIIGAAVASGVLVAAISSNQSGTTTVVPVEL